MSASVEIREAGIGDAVRLAELHLASRAGAMPYLPDLHKPAEIREWFERRVGNAPSGTFWVAQIEGNLVGYMAFYDHEVIDDLYVEPGMERRGVGTALLEQAKRLSLGRLMLWAFQRNINALEFYKAHGFKVVDSTAGANEENEPDFKLLWERAR